MRAAIAAIAQHPVLRRQVPGVEIEVAAIGVEAWSLQHRDLAIGEPVALPVSAAWCREPTPSEQPIRRSTRQFLALSAIDVPAADEGKIFSAIVRGPFRTAAVL